MTLKELAKNTTDVRKGKRSKRVREEAVPHPFDGHELIMMCINIRYISRKYELFLENLFSILYSNSYLNIRETY